MSAEKENEDEVASLKPLLVRRKMPAEISLLSPRAQRSFRNKKGKLSKVLLGLLMAGADAAQFLQQLRSDTLYRLEIPSGKILQEAPDGFLRGVFYGDTGISEHARFSKLSPEFSDLATNVAMQAQMLKISAQIEELDRKADRILIGQQSDRLAQVQAGIDLYQDALECSEQRRAQLLHQAIQTLSEGINKCLNDLFDEICSLRDVPSTWSQAILQQLKPGFRLEKETRAKCQQVERLLPALRSGSHFRSMCYMELDEPTAAMQALARVHERLRKNGFDRLLEYARQLPYEEESRVTTPLLELNNQGITIGELCNVGLTPVQIEFNKQDLSL